MTVCSYFQYFLGRVARPIRGHDSGQIMHCPAFRYANIPNMVLESTDCGSTGSPMLPHHTCLDEDSDGRFPDLRWTPPSHGEVKEYVLICEDLDLPIPFTVAHHGLFFNIPPSTTTACHSAVEAQYGNTKNVHVTNAGWLYVPNIKDTSYTGPAPPLGHGAHRYVFTIIALNAPLPFTSHDKVTKEKIKKEMAGKIIGFGHWTGVFQRPWPRRSEY